DLLLLLVLAAAALVLSIVTRCRPALALLGGFVLAWAALDARTIADHVAVVHSVESNGGNLPILSEAKVFADRAAVWLRSASWALDPSLETNPLVAHYFAYAFAERPRA